MVFSIFFMAINLPQRMKFMIVLLPEVSAFSEIKKAPRRLLSASVNLVCLQLKIIFMLTPSVQVGTHTSHLNNHSTLLAGIPDSYLASPQGLPPTAARGMSLQLKSDNATLALKQLCRPGTQISVLNSIL